MSMSNLRLCKQACNKKPGFPVGYLLFCFLKTMREFGNSIGRRIRNSSCISKLRAVAKCRLWGHGGCPNMLLCGQILWTLLKYWLAAGWKNGPSFIQGECYESGVTGTKKSPPHASTVPPRGVLLKSCPEAPRNQLTG